MAANGKTNVTLQYKSKKKNSDIMIFDDFNFPADLKNIKSYYGYRTKDKKRVRVSLKDILNDAGKHGCTYIHDKETDTYHLHYPVPVNYYPVNDRRFTENQIKSDSLTEFVTGDLGIRKFLTGIDSSGNELFVKTNTKLTQLLLKIDKEKAIINLLWTKVKNMIADLHWKVIKYLVTNYKVIIIGDIRTQDILKKKNISAMTKRILTQFSFFTFKNRLKYKSNYLNRQVIIACEAYTSKTCPNCGILNDVGKSEKYNCESCQYKNDRDIVDALNITHKVLTELESD